MAEQKIRFRYVTIDLETDGLDETVNRIAEIGAVATDEDGRLLSTFQSYVDPKPYRFDFKAPAFVGNGKADGYQGNGITKKNMILAPYESEVMSDFDKWLEQLSGNIRGKHNPENVPQLRLVFQNAAFDVAFLKAAFRRSCLPLDWFRRTLDTVSLGFALLPEHSTLSLQRLCEILKVENISPHGALYDAIATSNVFHILDKRSALHQGFSKSPYIIPSVATGTGESYPITIPYVSPNTSSPYIVTNQAGDLQGQ